jgi:hypothetical protein
MFVGYVALNEKRLIRGIEPAPPERCTSIPGAIPTN